MDNRRILQESLDYIEANLKSELTAMELAEKAGFSLYHYYRLFQTATGMPVIQYVTQRRLLHAIYDMGMGASKTDTALTYGFDTYPGFYRAFRREFGYTPADFLARYPARKPHPINLYQEESPMLTHNKLTEILKNWNLESQLLTDIYYEGSGQKNENACYVGDNYVIKCTTNPGRLQFQAE